MRDVRTWSTKEHVSRDESGLAAQRTDGDLPITIVGFAESVRKEASRGSGTALIPPSFTLILTGG